MVSPLYGHQYGVELFFHINTKCTYLVPYKIKCKRLMQSTMKLECTHMYQLLYSKHNFNMENHTQKIREYENIHVYDRTKVKNNTLSTV